VKRPERADGYSVYLGTGKRGSASNGRSGVRLWLERLDLVGMGASEKAFPREAFELSNDALTVVLGRYWSGDGFVSGTGTNQTPFAATSSRVLARQLQHLLLRFGIVARVTKKRFKYREGRTGYTVHLLGRRSIETFLTRIAPHVVGKDEQIARLRECLAAVAPGQETLDTVPPDVKLLVDEARREQGLTWRQLEDRSGVCVKEFYGSLKPHKKGFRRATIRKLADFFGSDRLRAAASDQVFWESVVEIESAGTAPTYDLEVEGEHNFVANDLIVHNSHSAAYGELSFQTAYLKAHYPVEFAAALLTVERANSDKVAQYVADTRHLGIEVLPPDINESRGDFTPVGGVVRFGLHGVKNVGDGAVEHVVAERERGGAFKDLFDFCRRVDTALVGKRALEHLVKAGAFDALGDRAALLANLEGALKWGTAQRESQAAGQMALFGAEDLKPPALEPAGELSELERLRMEKEALGLYISAHPMRSYPGLAEAASCPVDAIERWLHEQRAAGEHSGRLKAVLSGILQNVAKRPTRKGTMMARFEIADESGAREVVAFSRVFDEIADALLEDAPVVLVAEVSEEDEAVRLVADRLIRWDAREGVPEVAVLRFDPREIAPHQLLELRSLLDETAGTTPVQLRFESERGLVTWAAEGVTVNAQRLTEIEDACPWLRAGVTVDRGRLLADRGTGAPRAAAPRVDVPF
jgi:DNA polymerase-3 subunit alpha